MMNRRAFAGLLASTFAFASKAWAQTAQNKTVYFASVGPVLTLYDIDVEAATLTARGSVTLPANVQYAWPHQRVWLNVTRQLAGMLPIKHLFRFAVGERLDHNPAI